MIYKYIQTDTDLFTLRKLSFCLVEWIRDHKIEPSEIQLEPEEFIDFLQYSEQFINSPTFLGIPVVIDYGDQSFSKPSAPAVTKRRKKTTDK